MQTGNKILEELYQRPNEFYREGKSSLLWKEYQSGNLALETLIPILQHEDKNIISVGTYIVSELGNWAARLLNYIIPLLNNKEYSVRYQALETIATFSSNPEYTYGFVHVIEHLSNDNEGLRLLAMRLMIYANDMQLSYKYTFSSQKEAHLIGIELLTKKQVTDIQIKKMLYSKNTLLQRYATVWIGRNYKNRKASESLIEIAGNSSLIEVRNFMDYLYQLYDID